MAEDAPRCQPSWPRPPGLVVVDEAYGQFARWSALELVDEDVPWWSSRTYSKTWSMAALRLGYVIGPSEVVKILERVALPYHLDALKQAAGRWPCDSGRDGKRVARSGRASANG